MSAENGSSCGHYDAPGQTCLTAGMEVIAAEGLCGRCAVRVLTPCPTACCGPDPFRPPRRDRPMPSAEKDAEFATIERLVAEAHERGYALDALLTRTRAA